VEIRVLGPLEAIAEDRVLTIPGALPARLLALLARAPGREISTDELIEGLWPDGASRGAAATLQSHVSRLRRALAPSSVIETGHAGYRLVLDPFAIDAVAFEQAVTQGRGALERGSLEESRQDLSRAMDLWRGRPYAEFTGTAVLEIEATRLEQLRIVALELLLTAELRSPDVPPPVAELHALVQLHPFHEPMWALLMWSLYRSGQQAAALDTFQRARTLLVEELGLEPGVQLQEMESRILRRDPTLDPDRSLTTCALDSSTLGEQPGPELRVVTLLALEVDGRDPTDPELTALEQDRSAEIVLGLIESYQAWTAPGPEGWRLLALGAPSAHEDDPHRAVHLAWKIRSSHQELGLSISIGVATGPVLARSDGFHVSLTGEAVSVARQLSRSTERGEIFVDTATGNRVGLLASIQVDADGRLRIASAPQDPHPRPVSRTKFVGREQELEILQMGFQSAVSNRRPLLLTIVGEAGIGKTRLGSKFRDDLATSDVPIIWVDSASKPFGESDVFQGIADIVSGIGGIRAADGASAVVERLQTVIPSDEQEALVPRLAPLFGSSSFASADRVASFAAWARFIELGAAERALVLQIDDLQWAPQLLIDFLAYLTTRDVISPTLIITTYRPEFTSPVLSSLPDERHAELRLSRMTDLEMRSLFEHLDPTSSVSVDQLEQRVEVTAGVPLAAEELSRLKVADGLPGTTIRSLIQARLDTLPLRHRSILAAASISGGSFDVELLSASSGIAASEVLEIVDLLMEREFLIRAPTRWEDDTPTFAFVHDLQREVVFERIPRIRRALLHLEVARWRWGTVNRPDDEAGAVLFHATEAHRLLGEFGYEELTERARTLAVDAGLIVGQRLQGFDTSAAINQLRPILALVRRGTLEEARARLWLGAALSDDRQFEASLEHVEKALDLLEDYGDPLAVDAAFWHIMCSFSLGRTLSFGERALERIVGNLARSEVLVRAKTMLAMTSVLGQTESDLMKAVAYAAEAISLADELQGIQPAIAHVIHGRAALGLGDETGLSELVEWLDLVSAQESGSIAVGARQWLAGAQHHWVGPAAEWETRVVITEMAQARGLASIYSMSIAERVRVLWELGDYRGSVELADTVQDRDMTVDAQPRWVTVQRAMALAELGELEAEDVERVRTTPPTDPGDLRHALGAALILARWSADSGDREGAAAHLRRIGSAGALGDRDGATELVPRLVRLAINLGCDDILEELDDAIDERTPLRRIVGDHVRGLLAASRGDDDGARSSLTEALRGWERFGVVPEIAAARRDLDLLTPR